MQILKCFRHYIITIEQIHIRLLWSRRDHCCCFIYKHTTPPESVITIMLMILTSGNDQVSNP